MFVVHVGNGPDAELEPAAKLLAQAMQLPEDEREDLAARLLDSLEPPTIPHRIFLRARGSVKNE